ncbi:MAG TPA: hypothetical protein VME43_33010 [Bryobacteraceae bacterium]|nr:hypothetical protein [Bryobacteraceae bacterium]
MALVVTGGPDAIVMVSVALPVPLLFVALIVTGVVPAALGVPEMTPVEVLTDSPPGSPVAPKLVGELLAVIWYEKALPTAPFAVLALVITGGPDVTVTVSVVLPVPVLFVALIVTGVVPAALGVPEMTPVEVLTDSPPGNPVAPKLVGELLAVIW